MLNRRVMMAQKKAGPPPGGGIVTDGLVLRLNGNNRGNVPEKWLDEVNGYVFRLVGAAEKDNGVYMTGSSRIEAESNEALIPSNGTLEAVYDITKGERIISSSNAGKQLAIILLGKKIISGNKAARLKMYLCPNTFGMSTISISDARGFKNKAQLVRDTGVDYWSAAPQRITIGDADYPAGFEGTFYEARYYNRQLTEAEILQNQQHDIDTYFGGVTP